MPELDLDPMCTDVKKRFGEKDGTYFRSQRFYKVDGKYFFSTREGAEIGPYPSKPEAEEGLARFIDSIKKDGNTQCAKRLALSGNWAVTLFQ